MNSTTQLQENPASSGIENPVPVCLAYLKKDEKTIQPEQTPDSNM